MSRSIKKTPIFGIATPVSDKPFKQSEHRRERRAARIALRLEKELQSRFEYGNPWNTPKDGKRWWVPENKSAFMIWDKNLQKHIVRPEHIESFKKDMRK